MTLRHKRKGTGAKPVPFFFAEEFLQSGLCEQANRASAHAKEHIMPIIFFALVLVLQSAASTPASPNAIRVDIEGLRSDKGQVLCTIYSSAEGYPKDANKARMKAQSAIAGGRGVCEFDGLEPGTYAVAAFHDENSNGKLDSNFIGIPKEGTAASNNAKGHMGPPKFDDAAFKFSGGQMEMKVKMNYF